MVTKLLSVTQTRDTAEIDLLGGIEFSPVIACAVTRTLTVHIFFN